MPESLECGIPYTLIFPDIEIKGKKVLIQLPDGLKQFSLTIANCIREKYGVEPIIHMESIYGACDLQYNQIFSILNPDIIIHIGHSEYPNYIASPLSLPENIRKRIVFVKALSKIDIDETLVLRALEILNSYNVKNISVALTAQHTHLYNKIFNIISNKKYNIIESNGLAPYYEPGQIIGCDFRPVLNKKIDGYIFLGGGEFHPLGLYLATLKPIAQIDLYSNTVRDFTPIGAKYYKKRLFTISKAMEANHWGVIIGLKTGQYRPFIINMIIKMLSKKQYVLLSSENINEINLRSIDNDWYDAFIITSCPRIPIDDLIDYEKPVLTPGEAYMALAGKIDNYMFPW
ncbi:MAG: diphthamide biosynthesis enzyme Dph2 [Caldisphaera sp.]|nr:MAG: diphthamide biosynthesis enzyme Dph2 [Caldisphaera sp.]